MKRSKAKACVACRDGKRKCDRLIPSCSLCSRLGRRCQYGIVPVTSTPTTKTSVKTQHLQHHVPPRDLASLRQILDEDDLMLPRITNKITEKLSHAVGGISAVREVAAKYFRSIHLWFPIISERSYYERLPLTFDKPTAEHSLLSLSMALITTLPPKARERNASESFQALYLLLKTSVAIVEAANVNNLAVVQARLLLTLFEFGHGLSAAFISIAATTRAAVAIGLHQTVHNSCGNASPVEIEQEEGHRVWWGIVMLDRIYTLERGEGLCTTQGLGSPRHLPRDIGCLDQKILSSTAPLPLSTPSTVRIGPFARQAQVSHVLDIFLMYLRDQNSTACSSKAERDQIARTLTAFSLIFPEEAPRPWPNYCGAMGMCFTALMTLHSSDQDTSYPIDLGDPNCGESLASALNRLHYIATRFNQNIHQVEVDAISPFPPFGLAKAASMQFRLWRETGDPKHRDAGDELVLMVTHFSKRWGNAAKLLNPLYKEQELYKAAKNIY